MSTAEWSALLALCAATSFSPGPNTTLSAALAANLGLRASWRFVLSVPLGWALLFSLCSAGLGSLVLSQPALRWPVQLLGIAYLLWLAVKLGTRKALAPADAKPMQVTFCQGVMLQFLNLKVWLLALTVVAGWLAGRDDVVRRFALVLPTLLAFGLCSNFAYALLGSVARKWLADAKHGGRRLRWFNRCMAALLVATAASLAVL